MVWRMGIFDMSSQESGMWQRGTQTTVAAPSKALMPLQYGNISIEKELHENPIEPAIDCK